MEKFDFSHCDCNNYDEVRNLTKICTSKCGDEPDKPSNQSCCQAQCIVLDNSIVVDKKINTTAMASFYGPVGDLKIMENIEECIKISKTSYNLLKLQSLYFLNSTIS